MNMTVKPRMLQRSQCGRRAGWTLLAVSGWIMTSCDQNKPAAATGAEDAGEDPVALVVGERDVRLGELQDRVDLLQRRKSPLVENREVFLDSCVERLVMLEQARKMGLDEDPELQRQWENLLIGKFKQQMLDRQLKELEVSDEEVRQYFEKNRDEYARPAQVRMALLFLKVPAKGGDEASNELRARMEEARTKATELPSDTHGFGALAMNYSEEATSRFKGGDIGWLQQGSKASRWPDTVVDAAFGLSENGSLSEVIATDDGFYLLRRMDHRDAVIRPLEGRFRATLENALISKKRIALEEELKTGWLESEPVTVREEIVSQLKFHPAGDPEQDSQTFPTPD